MARFVAGVVAGIVITTLAGAALGLRAQDPSTDVQEAAAQAGVDAQDLLGAVNTTGVDPYVYLRGVGELPPLKPPPRPAIRVVWDLLAQCESQSNWRANTGNGFFGGIQFDYGTWLRHGGAMFAPRADLATREQQVIIAERTLATQGWSAWPSCARRLGLR